MGLLWPGGAVVTYSTYRRNRFEQDRTYRQTRIEQDRTYERELYATAIEQLGHDHAPVRLGALYSLATLGQDRPDRRRMVVDVLCAYLRMPYAPLPESPDAPSDQERQVRLTAERLLSEHVRRPDGVAGEDAQLLPQSPDVSYWPKISLDLTGAFLIDLNLRKASVVDARFAMATFTGDAGFNRATFTRGALFEKATFRIAASFDEAQVLNLDDPILKEGGYGRRRVWPNGWTVRANADDLTRGTLVHEPPALSLEPPDG